MKILVTGGAGFIGSHLVEKLLDEGHEVTVFDDFNDFYDSAIKEQNVASFGDRVQVVRLDIRDREKTIQNTLQGKFEVIIHLAARAGVRPSIADPELYLATNVSGTFHLLEAAKQLQVQQFIFASSSSVYGNRTEVPFSESLALYQTISPYAATKVAGEHLCSNYSHLYQIPTVCLRFFTVYGPRQRPDLAIHSFTNKIYRGNPIQQYGDGSTARDYTYIDDIVQGIVASMSYRETPFEIFNLGGSQTTQLSELIKLIEEALGKKAIINQIEEQPGDVRVTYADVSKAEKLLGYNVTTPIRYGVQKFVEWYLANRS